MQGLLSGSAVVGPPRVQKVAPIELKDHVDQAYYQKAIYRNQGNMKGLLPGATGAHVPR